MPNRLRIVGLVGGIGSGKSTVAAIFKKYGARVVDADVLAHRALDRPEVRRALIRAWGSAVVRGGRVLRAEVARRAFRSPAALKKLTRAVHPHIRRDLKREIAAARRLHGLLVVDAALLLETGTASRCDRLIFVDAPRATRARRVRSRKWTAEELRRRERLQWPVRRKRAAADYRIDNGGSKAVLKRQIRTILQELTRS
ncbi:MAG: dephospho-CoA kinase [Planctomycetes bacterium]|nr:dephospho-CoA kinase [Planctomycetota bacterium]